MLFHLTMIKTLFKRWVKKGIAISIIFPFIFLIWADYHIENNAKGHVFNSTSQIPFHEVGMVLGTAKYLKSGQINVYYSKRIKATVDLYKGGKIKFVLVSGDNGSTRYDEPSTFKSDLIKAGIPGHKIFLDYAGFRTLDSVIRAKKIFGQSNLTIISQKFHIERAIYLAQSKGMIVDGYEAGNYTKAASWGLKIREKLARAKAVIDILFNISPKFLGEKIEIH